MKSCDTETTGLDKFHGAKPFFVTICREGGEIMFWQADVDPMTREPQWSKSDLDEILNEVLDGGELVFQNAKFDVGMLNTILPGISDDWPWEQTHETLYSGHLLNSNQPHDLTTMSLVYLGINIKPYEDAIKQAATEARRLCRNKDFIERHGQWAIAHKDRPDMPSCKESAWGFDMWLPRAVAKAEWEASDASKFLVSTMDGWEWRPPSEMWEGHHPWWTVLEEYSNADSEVTLPLHVEHRRLLEERGLWRLYVERLKMLPIVYSMEQRGITLGRTRLEELQTEYREKSEEDGKVCVNIAASYGHELTLPKAGSNNSLRDFVFDVLKLESPKTSKKSGEPSFDKSVLEHFIMTTTERSKPGAFIRRLEGKRSMDTALGFMQSYQKYWLPVLCDAWEMPLDREGYVTDVAEWMLMHSSLNPTGTDTLRWSSQGPNQQQISKKEVANLRYLFGPLPGREWWSLDYDNLELRIPAYESGERVMIDLFERPDEAPYFGSYHLLNASIVYPDLFWPIAEERGAFKNQYNASWYKWTKNGGFAIQYGCQEKKADETFRRAGAYRAIKERLPAISALNDRQVALANQKGYVETIPDREIDPDRGYPLNCLRTRWGDVSPTLPMNYHVQGTACWIMMRAMFKVRDYIRQTGLDAAIVMNVHDELVLDLPFAADQGNRPWVDEVRRIMGSVGDCVGVKLTVGASYCPDDWSQAT